MKRIKIITALLVISILLIGGLGSSVIAKDMTGEDILEKVDKEMNSETRDFILEMTIINENGQERDRKITIKTKGENKGLVKFLEPGDVKDTALLTVKEDGQEK